MTIRPATAADAEALAEMFRLEAESQSALSGAFSLDPNADWRAYARERIARVRGCVLVAAEGEALIGFVDCRLPATDSRKSWRLRLRRWLRPRVEQADLAVRPARAFIESIWVSVEHRRRGAGSALLAEALRQLRERGASAVEGSIWWGNATSYAMSQKAGFTPLRTIVQWKLPD